MSRKLRESFVGHPDAIVFLRISRKGVFQQPRLFAPTIPIVGWFRESCCRNESSSTSCVFVRMQEWRYVESAEMVNQHDGLFPLIDLKEDERLAVRCEGGLGYTLSERHEETCFPGVELIEEKRAFSGAVIDNKIDSH